MVHVDIAALLVEHICMEEHILIVEMLWRLLEGVAGRVSSISSLVERANGNFSLLHLLLDVHETLVTTKLAHQTCPLSLMIVAGTCDERSRSMRHEDAFIA